MRDHISVCICTYKRPKMLERLFKELENQKTDDLFTYSITVVDNDYNRSAARTIAHIKERSRLDIAYYHEPEQNISLARNKAIQNAKDNLVAFIDDDEFPEPAWFFHLYKAYIKYDADGILGPVKPYFEIKPPSWVIKGKLCERPSFKTGTVLTNPLYTRTGNTLLSKEIFNEQKNLFDPRYGKTGGEDVDFFRRMIQKGRVFVWCEEAGVYETVPPERLKRKYFLKRAIIRGQNSSKNAALFSFSTLKSIGAFVLYTCSLPFLMLIGHHLFMKYLIRDCDHIGKLFGFFGLNLKRNFE